MSMPLAVGIVGAGIMGRRHVLGMQRLKSVGKLTFELTAVCDIVPENAERMAAQSEELLGRRAQPFTDVDSMLYGAALDALIITTTPERHVEVALKAFAAGLHVMAEKPITLTVAEGRRLVQAGRKAGRKVAVAENYRRDPINRLGRALVDGGAIGTPFLMVQASSGSGEFVVMTPWRHRKDRGGIVVDMGVHYADILEYYLGPIDRVVGMSAVVDAERVDPQGVRHPCDAEDLSVGVMRFRSGAIANWLLSIAGRGEHMFARTIYGTGGSLSIPGDRSGKPLGLVQRRAGVDVAVPLDQQLSFVPDFSLDTTTAALFGGERMASYDIPWVDIDANLLGIEQADFVDAIQHNREPEVNGEQGLRSLAVLDGLLESEGAGRILSLDEILQTEKSV
ncbi:MAG: Gfo/Idh/MocA family oxidoreductase [Anaerolineales bacterium]